MFAKELLLPFSLAATREPLSSETTSPELSPCQSLHYECEPDTGIQECSPLNLAFEYEIKFSKDPFLHNCQKPVSPHTMDNRGLSYTPSTSWHIVQDGLMLSSTYVSYQEDFALAEDSTSAVFTLDFCQSTPLTYYNPGTSIGRAGPRCPDHPLA